MASIKLLALDIDGTLLTPESRLTPGNRMAIERARREGVRVVLVTGRRFGSAYALLRELELDLPLVAHNGALTKDVETLELIDYHPLDLAMAREIVRLGRLHGADMLCCDDPHGHGILVNEGISAGNLPLRRYLDRYHESVVEVPDLLDYVDHSPIQMMFSGRCGPMDELAALLEVALGDRIRIFKTRYRQSDLTILDAISPTASKGASLAEFASRHGIVRDEVMAIGDNHNDLTMLRYAGRGVVMANAEDDLKQMDFAVTASNEDDGVALAIERFILGVEAGRDR